VTSACITWDQQHAELKTLLSYEGTKGFTLENMTELIDVFSNTDGNTHDGKVQKWPHDKQN